MYENTNVKQVENNSKKKKIMNRETYLQIQKK